MHTVVDMLMCVTASNVECLELEDEDEEDVISLFVFLIIYNSFLQPNMLNCMFKLYGLPGWNCRGVEPPPQSMSTDAHF